MRDEIEKMTDKIKEDYSEFQIDLQKFHENNERTGLPREYQIMSS